MADASALGAVTIDFAISQYAQTLLQAASDADGSVPTFLQEIWNSPLAQQLKLCVVTLSPTSNAGTFQTSGRNVTASDPGLFFPSGGCVLYLFSLQDVRNFRIQAQAGGTCYFTAAGYR